MSQPHDAPAEPIQVIVRRRHDEDEGHHGGVWKIAYADFMTAMMAFFLVMWLVNASDTEMKTSVASYFNPIKLSDTVIRQKGLVDVDGKANTEDRTPARQSKTLGMSESILEDGTRNEPGDGGGLGLRDQQRQAAVPDLAQPPHDRAGGAMNAGRASEAGRAFRDPFNPFAPAQLMSKEGADKEQPRDRVAGLPAGSGPRPSTAGEGQGAPLSEAALPGIAESARQMASPRQAANGVPSDQIAQTAMLSGKRPDAVAGAGPKPLEATAADVLRDIQQAAKTMASVGGPGIEVTVEGNGIVLSLTDTSTFGMFAIGSSDPSPQTIELIARIAPVLVANSKRIVVRGHTDSRAYRTENNNNWRLSMSRAEAAYAMLVRAGVDEARFIRIEGYADRKLKVPGDSEAAANRRIEILLQQGDE